MPEFNQKGFANILLFILLAAGIGLGVYLVQNRTNLFPQASISAPIAPKTGFTLASINPTVSKEGEFYIKVGVNSDFDAANLFTLGMTYPADKVQVIGISPSSGDGVPQQTGNVGDTFVNKWIEQSNQGGTIVLSGAVPNPGLKTGTGQTATMATIYFKVIPGSSGDIPLIVKGDSAIYRNSDNQNIMGSNAGVTLKIGTPVPSVGSSSPKPTACPSGTSTIYGDPQNGGTSIIKCGTTPVPSCKVCPVPSLKTGCDLKVIDACNCQYQIVCASVSPSPLPPQVDGKRADLFKDSKKPNFVNDQDVSVFFTKCAEKGLELFGQPASKQPICDIFEDGKITVQDWAVLIKYRNKAI